MIKIGNKLTVDHDVIDISGSLVLTSGQEVFIRDIDNTPARWSNAFSMFMPEKINWVKLEGFYGCWLLSTFKETKSLI